MTTVCRAGGYGETGRSEKMGDREEIVQNVFKKMWLEVLDDDWLENVKKVVQNVC